MPRAVYRFTVTAIAQLWRLICWRVMVGAMPPNVLRVSRAALSIEITFGPNPAFNIATISLAASGVGCTRVLDAHVVGVCLCHWFGVSLDPKRARIAKEISNQWMPNHDSNMNHILMLRIHALPEADNSERPLPKPAR